jgi:hypothetical protein
MFIPFSWTFSRPVTSIGRTLDCKSGDKFDSRKAQVTFVVTNQSFLRSFTLYLCSCVYRSYQFLAKMKATSTGKLLDSLPRNNAVAELSSGKFIISGLLRDPK